MLIGQGLFIVDDPVVGGGRLLQFNEKIGGEVAEYVSGGGVAWENKSDIGAGFAVDFFGHFHGI